MHHMLKVFSFSEIVSFTLLSLFLHTLLFLIVFLFSDFFLSLHYFSDSILFYFILLFFIFLHFISLKNGLCQFTIQDLTIHDPTVHDSCISYVFLWMPRTNLRKGIHLSWHQKHHYIIRIGLDSVSIKQKADKTTRNLFPAVHNLHKMAHQSHLICSQNLFMQFTVK